MSGRIELRRAGARPRSTIGSAPVSAADVGWILLLPAVAAAAAVIALLAPLGGRLFPDPAYHYWTERGVRKPEVHAGYLLFVLLAVAYAGAIVKLARLRMDPLARRVLVALAQALGVAFVLACWLGQREISTDGGKVYFTPATLVAAAAMAGAAGLVIQHRDRLRDPLARLSRADPGLVRYACLGGAALATVVWVLPAVHSEGAPAAGITYLNSLFFDEAMAVLNGRHPLVDMVAYGSVWPYVAAVPLAAFGGEYAAYSVTMAVLTGIALLAVYGVLRRVARHDVLALVLYLPVLASGFFLEQDMGDELYHAGTYYGMFPLRYAGPYLLAWLTARHIQRQTASRWSPRLLFAAAGLVALNNVDFGASALAATALAIAVSRRAGNRRALARLAADLGIGLLMALALVSAVTLARAGSLPHLDLLLRYGRVFVNGGYGNLPLPGLGVHLVVSATFVAAGAVAAVRVARAEQDDLLGAMLAWCATFGLGASVYYYAYRSHPDVLISLFSIWSLTLALLVVAVVRAASSPRRWPSAPSLAVLFGFALAACSIAQVPGPGEQLRRIFRDGPSANPWTMPAGSFREAAVTRIVAERTRAGEPVVILSPVGHRVAHDAGVVNVSPYTGFEQMPAREQLDETLGVLEREGGSKVFVAETEPPGLARRLGQLGFDPVVVWTELYAWPEATVSVYRAS
jgi:hypothetical protein